MAEVLRRSSVDSSAVGATKVGDHREGGDLKTLGLPVTEDKRVGDQVRITTEEVMESRAPEMSMSILLIDEREGEDPRSDDAGGLRKETTTKTRGGSEAPIPTAYWQGTAAAAAHFLLFRTCLSPPRRIITQRNSCTATGQDPSSHRKQ